MEHESIEVAPEPVAVSHCQGSLTDAPDPTDRLNSSHAVRIAQSFNEPREFVSATDESDSGLVRVPAVMPSSFPDSENTRRPHLHQVPNVRGIDSIGETEVL